MLIEKSKQNGQILVGLHRLDFVGFVDGQHYFVDRFQASLANRKAAVLQEGHQSGNDALIVEQLEKYGFDVVGLRGELVFALKFNIRKLFYYF